MKKRYIHQAPTHLERGRATRLAPAKLDAGSQVRADGLGDFPADLVAVLHKRRQSAPLFMKRLMAAVAFDEAVALRVLKQTFGHSAFRKNQLDIIKPVLQGRDVMVLMATGSGKSRPQLTPLM